MTFPFFAVIFCVVAAPSLAQYPINETCPDICEPEVEITNEKLQGVWWLQSFIPHFFEMDTKCTYLNVTELGEYHLHYDKIEFHNT